MVTNVEGEAPALYDQLYCQRCPRFEKLLLVYAVAGPILMYLAGPGKLHSVASNWSFVIVPIAIFFEGFLIRAADGCGFVSQRQGRGLASMQRRAQALGATLASALHRPARR